MAPKFRLNSLNSKKVKPKYSYLGLPARPAARACGPERAARGSQLWRQLRKAHDARSPSAPKRTLLALLAAREHAEGTDWAAVQTGWQPGNTSTA